MSIIVNQIKEKETRIAILEKELEKLKIELSQLKNQGNGKVPIRRKIHNISLVGGGFFGFAHVAALKESLERYKEYLDIQHISGVSVGSMVAALFAVGYTPEELTKVMFEFDFDRLIKDSMFPYLKLYEKYGMYEACKLEEEIERLIRIKTNIKFCTFNQIKMNLTIIATNLNWQCPRFFSRENTPDVPISKAVRMSIGYPLVMCPVPFEEDLYGDGGVYMNYPILMFEDCLDETIGFTFSAHNENSNGTLKNRIPINDVYDSIRSMGTTMSRAAYVSQISQKFLDRSIVIHIGQNISSMQFGLTKEQKTFIYDCGSNAVREQMGVLLDLDEPINVPTDATDTIPQPEEKSDTPTNPIQNLMTSVTSAANVKLHNPDTMDAVKVLMAANPQSIGNLVTDKLF